MIRLVAFAGLVVVALFLVASCGADTNVVTLTFATSDGGPHGFICKGSNGEYLAQQAVEQQSLSVVVDFFALDATPVCRGSEIIGFCQDPSHSCTLLTDRRVCTSLVVPKVMKGASLGSALEDALKQLHSGKPITDDAPNQPVIIRVVATTEPCCEGQDCASAFDPTHLIGCANSCPVYLPEAGDEVELDLDVLPPSSCTLAQVAVCATDDFKRLHF